MYFLASAEQSISVFLIATLGWISVIMLAVSGLPQLFKMIKVKTVDGVSFLMLSSWFLGCFGMFCYVRLTSKDLQLSVNYGWASIINLALVVIYLIYKNKKS